MFLVAAIKAMVNILTIKILIEILYFDLNCPQNKNNFDVD